MVQKIAHFILLFKAIAHISYGNIKALKAPFDALFAKGKFSWYLFIGSMVAAIVGYYYCIAVYMTNFPYSDDYGAILNFLSVYDFFPDLKNKLLVIFSQHNEHRIIFNKLVTLWYYTIAGEVNFEGLNLIGNASLLLIAFTLYRSGHELKKNLLYVVPVVFLLFSFRNFEVAFWAMASLANLWVIVFAFLSLYYLLIKEDPWSFAFAVFFAVFASYTIASGVMTFMAGALALFLMQGTSRKFYVWLFISAVNLAVFFSLFTHSSKEPGFMTTFLNDPLSLVWYCLVFLGSAFAVSEKQAILVGVILVLLSLVVSVKKYYKINPVVFSFIVFIFCTVFINALGRFVLGPAHALSPRYSTYSILLASCLFIAYTEMYKGKWRSASVLLAVLAALGFHVWCYFKFLPWAIHRKENFLALKEVNYASFDFGTGDFDKTYCKTQLKNAGEKGIFHFPLKDTPDPMRCIATKHDLMYSIEFFDKKDSLITVSGWVFVPSHNSAQAIPLLAIYKDSTLQRYLMAERSIRPDVKKSHLSSLSHKFSGFTAIFNVNDLPAGDYQLGLSVMEGDSITSKRTEKKIDVRK